MATFDSESFWDSVRQAPVPTWTDPDELNRVSIEAHQDRDNDVRVLPSHGRLRLFGEAIQDHSVDIDAAAKLLINFQKAVRAWGASMKGIKALRGKLPLDVFNLTQLRIQASPLPGSVIFQLQPGSMPTEELSDEGYKLFDREIDQLVDQSVLAVIAVLNIAEQDSPDGGEVGFIQIITDAGPRVASAVRDLADSAQRANLGMDFKWAIPHKTAEGVKLSAQSARWITQVIRSRDLDSELVEFEGKLVTLSNLKAWQVDIGDSIVPIDMAELSQDLSEFHLNQMVRIRALQSARDFPGGQVSYRYIATLIEAH